MLGALLLCRTLLTHADARNPTERYIRVPAGADGIGKRYMGRDLAGVMGRQGAAWLEREERTDLLVTALWLKTGMAVANIGADTGHLARDIAPANCTPNAHGATLRRRESPKPACELDEWSICARTAELDMRAIFPERPVENPSPVRARSAGESRQDG